MPNYFDFKIYGVWLYFTSHCVVEAFHIHSSKGKRHSESTAAKWFVKENGELIRKNDGDFSKEELNKLEKFIKKHYKKMYKKWKEYSDEDYYRNEKELIEVTEKELLKYGLKLIKEV